jgi:hypothetical protein
MNCWTSSTEVGTGGTEGGGALSAKADEGVASWAMRASTNAETTVARTFTGIHSSDDLSLLDE